MNTLQIFNTKSIVDQATIWLENTNKLGYHSMPIDKLRTNPLYQEVVDGLLLGIVSEFSEIFEAYRRNKYADFASATEEFVDNFVNEKIYRMSFEDIVKGTVQEELADVYIRCLDYIGYLELQGLDRVDLDNRAYGFQTIPNLIMYSVNMLMQPVSDSYKIANVVNNLVIFCRNNDIHLTEYVDWKIRYNLLTASKGDKKF